MDARCIAMFWGVATRALQNVVFCEVPKRRVAVFKMNETSSKKVTIIVAILSKASNIENTDCCFKLLSFKLIF